MKIALSPGPFHADAVAVAKDNRVELYIRLRHFASDMRSHAEYQWSFPDKVDSVRFSPNGRRLAIGIFKAASIVIADIEKGLLMELSEPLKGSGMVSCEWIFDDWIVSVADFGLHLALWNANNLTAPEEEPDRISKPKICADNPSLVVVAYLKANSSHSAGDLIALAHGESDISIFACTSRDRRWAFQSKWRSKNAYKLEWIDPNRVLVLADPLTSGELVIKRADDGQTLTRFSENGGFANFTLNRLGGHLVAWKSLNGFGVYRTGNASGTQRHASITTDLYIDEQIVQDSAFNGDGSRVAFVIIAEENLSSPASPDNNALVFRRPVPMSDTRATEAEISITINLDEYVGLRWDPTLTNRLVVVLKTAVILWKKDDKPEIVHKLDDSSGVEHRDVQWNSVGNMLIVTFTSRLKHRHQAPVVISLEF